MTDQELILKLKKRVLRLRSQVNSLQSKLNKSFVYKDGIFVPYPDSITRRKKKPKDLDELAMNGGYFSEKDSNAS